MDESVCIKKLLIGGIVGVCVLFGGCGNPDFIASYYVDGEMEQFDFWRSVDTIGQEIEVPDFMDDLGYEIWN
jgi:hypothetical protein